MVRRPRSFVSTLAPLAVGALVVAAGLAISRPAQARGPDDRPWGRGTMVPTLGLGAGGFFSDIANLSFGLGFNYYLVNGLSAGIGVSDTVLIYRSTIKAQYPGIENALPTNIVDITPTLQYVFFRSRRFSPYVYGGAGPVFFNHGVGTYGQWVAGPGAYFNVGGPIYVNVGVGFSGLFPTGRCQDSLTYETGESAVLLDLCSFQWGPQLGVVLAFGGGRQARRERRDHEREGTRPPPRSEPARNPMPDAVEPEPEPEPEPETQTDPDVTAPTDVAEPPESDPDAGAPTDVVAPPEPEPGTDAGAPTDVAAPPGAGAEPSTNAGPSTDTAAPEPTPEPTPEPDAG